MRKICKRTDTETSSLRGRPIATHWFGFFLAGWGKPAYFARLLLLAGDLLSKEGSPWHFKFGVGRSSEAFDTAYTKTQRSRLLVGQEPNGKTTGVNLQPMSKTDRADTTRFPYSQTSIAAFVDSLISSRESHKHRSDVDCRDCLRVRLAAGGRSSSTNQQVLTERPPNEQDMNDARLSVANAEAYLTDTALRHLLSIYSEETANWARLLYPEFGSLLLMQQAFQRQRENATVDVHELVSTVQHLFQECMRINYIHIYIPVYHMVRVHWCLIYVQQCNGRRVFNFIDSIAAVQAYGGDIPYYEANLRDFIEPLRAVFDEVDRLKQQHYTFEVMFGSQLKHLSTQTDKVSCGIYVCEYARRLFSLESSNAPMSLLQPVYQDPVLLRKLFSDVLGSDAPENGTRTTVQRQMTSGINMCDNREVLSPQQFDDAISDPVALTQEIKATLTKATLYSKARERKLLDLALSTVPQLGYKKRDNLVRARSGSFGRHGLLEKAKAKTGPSHPAAGMGAVQEYNGRQYLDKKCLMTAKMPRGAKKHQRCREKDEILRTKEKKKKRRKRSQTGTRTESWRSNTIGKRPVAATSTSKPVPSLTDRCDLLGSSSSIILPNTHHVSEDTNSLRNKHQTKGEQRNRGWRSIASVKRRLSASLPINTGSCENVLLPAVESSQTECPTSHFQGQTNPPKRVRVKKKPKHITSIVGISESTLHDEIYLDKANSLDSSPFLQVVNDDRDKSSEKATRTRVKDADKKRKKRLVFNDETGAAASGETGETIDIFGDLPAMEPAGGCLVGARVEDSTIDATKRLKRFRLICLDSPIYPCCVCHQLKLRASVSSLKNSDERIGVYSVSHRKIKQPFYMCRTCSLAIQNGNVPKLAASRVKLPLLPTELEGLARLERTLIALRIPFMTIRALPRGGQVSLRGNFVNIPVALETSMCVIPRHLSATETVVVKLKRRKLYKSTYIHEAVRVDKLFKAAKYLVSNSPLYQEEGARLSHEWNELDGAYAGSDDEAFEGFDHSAVISMVNRFPFLDSEKCGMPCTTAATCAGTGSNTVSASLEMGQQIPAEGERNAARSDSDDDWDEALPLDEAQVPPAETVTMDADMMDKVCWDIVVAPGEGSLPCSVFADPNTMAKCFPTIFGGEAMPCIEDKGISWSEFSKWMMGRVERRVALTVEAIFFLFKVVQIKQMKSAVQVAMRKGNAKGRIPVGQLLQPEGLEAFVKNDDGYRVLRQIRGSPSYWQHVQKEVFAMVRQLGKPSLFMSFSAAETRWPVLMKSLAETADGTAMSTDEAEALPWETKCRLIRSDPDTCVRYFDSRYRALVAVFLRRGHSGAVGVVQDSIYRVEFQQRGSPHIHSLWWLENAPQIGVDADCDIAAYVDKHITCASSSDTRLPISYQTHRHSKTCKKLIAGQRTCRFSFPKPPMRKTMVLWPLDESSQEPSRHSHSWKKVQLVLEGLWKEPIDLTFDNFLEEVELKEEAYILTIRSTLKRPEIFLKRAVSEIRINAYNVELFMAWQANMDIQFVLDPYAAAKYIVSYMLKDQRGISRTMKSVIDEVQGGNMSLWSRLRKVSNTFLNCVEVSEQEAVWMIRQLPLYRCSRDCIFVNAAPRSERVVLLKPIHELQRLNELDADSCEVECDNVIKRYARRPSVLENISLASFATWYDCTKPLASKDKEKASTPNATDEELDDQSTSMFVEESSIEKHIWPFSVPFENKVLRRRSYQKILRSPRFWEARDKEKHFFEKLMLYYPWRGEEADLLVSDDGSLEKKWQDLVASHPQIMVEMRQYDKMGAALDAVIEDVQRDDTDENVVAAPVGGNLQHIEEIDAANATSVLDSEEVCHDNIDSLADAGLHATIESVAFSSHLLDQKDYLRTASALNPEQKRLFYDMIYQIKYCEAPLRLFVTGGAGVGKSFLLRVLYQNLIRHYRKMGPGFDPVAETVLVIAPTGKAAHVINGYTVHNALRIPANQSLKVYKKLEADKLNTVRRDLRALRVVIIDEISMIGFHLFRYIDMRLRDITDVRSESFGGLHVLCFGDLFQLRPVKDSYVFQVPNSYQTIADNPWSEFSMFELTVIMRQKDDLRYAELLNRIREGHHSEEDVDEVLKRSVSEQEVIRLVGNGVLCICRTNERARVLNEARLHASCELQRTFLSIDRDSNKKECVFLNAKSDAQFTAGLPTSVTVAVGMRVELTINVDTSDGLTNGAAGIVKGFSNKVLGLYWSQEVTWVLFDDSMVGKKRRQLLKRLYRFKMEDTPEAQFPLPLPQLDWTPIVREVRPISISRNASLDRFQMPLRAAAAKTIHRAQGDSYESVITDFSVAHKSPSLHHMYYVALSRVRSITGLKVLNFNPQKISVDPLVRREVYRLRNSSECRFLFKLPTTNILSDAVVVYFHNITSLRSNFEFLRTEGILKACQVLVLAECRVTSTEVDKYILKSFHPPDLPKRSQTCYGLGMYVSSSLLNYTISRCGTEDLSIEVAAFQRGPTSIIGLYRSPTSDIDTLFRMISSTIERLSSRRIIILGDFNIDKNGIQFRKLHLFMSQYDLRFVDVGPTTDVATTIDHIFTNCGELSGHVLQSFYSFHSPILGALPLKW